MDFAAQATNLFNNVQFRPGLNTASARRVWRRR